MLRKIKTWNFFKLPILNNICSHFLEIATELLSLFKFFSQSISVTAINPFRI